MDQDVKNEALVNKLRNAVARNELFVITGAGISRNLKSENGDIIPNWTDLVLELKKRTLNEIKDIDRSDRDFLDRLTPEGHMGGLHGDVLIEASQVIEDIIKKENQNKPKTSHIDFHNWILELIIEKVGEKGETHERIVELCPRGIITFNYDRCHENSFKKGNAERVLYSDDETLKEKINSGFDGPPIILKAHGCVETPESLVLTSSSYFHILNERRVYRAVMQHILSRFTILIVGFALRDRDFDQMLATLEKDFGGSIQDHIVIMSFESRFDENNLSAEEKKAKRKEADKKKNQAMANFAVLEARYNLQVLAVDDYGDIPEKLKEIYENGGSWIEDLAIASGSRDCLECKNSNKPKRCKAPDDCKSRICRKARMDIQQLSELGKEHFKRHLHEVLEDKRYKREKSDKNYLKYRSEILYTLGLLKPRDNKSIEILLSECETRSQANFHTPGNDENIECIAHALVSLRNCATDNNHKLTEIKDKLYDNTFVAQLNVLDSELGIADNNPRLLNYARSAYSEFYARSKSLF